MCLKDYILFYTFNIYFYICLHVSIRAEMRFQIKSFLDGIQNKYRKNNNNTI